jgi:hypothetical protein
MTLIPLSENENNFLYFCKGHYGRDFWPSVGKVYCESYDMEEVDLEGIYHMIRRLWWKLFQAKEFDERFLEEYERLSLPSNNWQVWGGLNSDNLENFWKRESLKWTSEDFLKAKITSMVGQLKLSNMKYWNKKPPSSEFAGLKLVTKLEFFEE